MQIICHMTVILALSVVPGGFPRVSFSRMISFCEIESQTIFVRVAKFGEAGGQKQLSNRQANGTGMAPGDHPCRSWVFFFLKVEKNYPIKVAITVILIIHIELDFLVFPFNY